MIAYGLELKPVVGCLIPVGEVCLLALRWSSISFRPPSLGCCCARKRDRSTCLCAQGCELNRPGAGFFYVHIWDELPWPGPVDPPCSSFMDWVCTLLQSHQHCSLSVRNRCPERKCFIFSLQHGLYQTGFPIKQSLLIQLNHRPSFFLSLLPQEGVCLLAHGQLLFGHPP